MAKEIVALEDGGECAHKRCQQPKVTIRYNDGSTVTVHDDGSFDGHPAWAPDSFPSPQ